MYACAAKLAMTIIMLEIDDYNGFANLQYNRYHAFFSEFPPSLSLFLFFFPYFSLVFLPFAVMSTNLYATYTLAADKFNVRRKNTKHPSTQIQWHNELPYYGASSSLPGIFQVLQYYKKIYGQLEKYCYWNILISFIEIEWDRGSFYYWISFVPNGVALKWLEKKYLVPPITNSNRAGEKIGWQNPNAIYRCDCLIRLAR